MFACGPAFFQGAVAQGWTATVIPTSGGGPVCYCGNQTFVYIQVATTASIGISTNNGQTWSLVTLPGTVRELRGICSDGAGNILITCGSSAASSAYFYSKNYGATWTQGTLPGSQFYYVRGYGNGVWVAGAQLNVLYTSPDLVTWTANTPGVSNNYGTISNGAGSWLMWEGNSSGTFVSTNNAATWAAAGTIPTLSVISQASYTGSRVCLIVGPSAYCQASYTDNFGTSWSAGVQMPGYPSSSNYFAGSYYTPANGGATIAPDWISNKIAASHDGGATWAYSSFPRLTTTGCYMATDGAGTWVYVPNTGTGTTAAGVGYILF